MKIFRIYVVLAAMAALVACKKSFLEEKPDRALLVPETLSDLRAFLDNPAVMNSCPTMGIIAADELVNSGQLNDFVLQLERSNYLWERDIYKGSNAVADWRAPYVQVINANIVLSGTAQLIALEGEGQEARELRGAALFYRGMAFFNLAQTFTAAYDPATLESLPGIPIKLLPDIAAPSVRGTLGGTYLRIEQDLLEAFGLLGESVQIKSRPGKRAAAALLARLYLVMGDYQRAEGFADYCLLRNSVLLDYNTLNPALAFPFPVLLPNNNVEVIYYGTGTLYSFYSSSQTVADPGLYALYGANDLRKIILFNDKRNFKGSYLGARANFTGLANDELYLVQAECLARRGLLQEAIDKLNMLLSKRYRTGTFVPLQVRNAAQVLATVLAERRKELVCRSLRWSDLKRLNRYPATAVLLTRVFGNETFLLEPGSRRYVFPIPDDEVNLSGLEQNPR